MKKMDRLDQAIADFEDETLELSLGERISNLRLALTWAVFERLKLIHLYGKKSPEAEDLHYKQVECQKQFKIINQLYTDQLRQNKLIGKAHDDGIDKNFLAKIKEQKSSIGQIVRDLRTSEN